MCAYWVSPIIVFFNEFIILSRKPLYYLSFIQCYL